VITAFYGFLVVSLAVTLVVAGLLLAQRLVPLSIRESHNAAIGIIYAALYVMFGVMVGFSAYIVLNKYNTSQNTVKSEAKRRGAILARRTISRTGAEPSPGTRRILRSSCGR
jgi:cytosine/uracil/thiamine/allantoin permease